MILHVIDYSSAAYYGPGDDGHPKKRGPKTVISDEALKHEIKQAMDSIPFHGTGYKKIYSRTNSILKERGQSVGKNRVFRLMREENLLNRAPGGTGSSRLHDGTLVTDAPDVVWGTDGKKFFTRRDGWCWLFDVIDHFNSEIVGYNVVKYGDRFEATRAVQNAVKHRFGSLDKESARGLVVRSDRGSQYTSEYYAKSMDYLGIEISHTWARSPESNGIIERFHRTIEEQLFSLHDLETLEEAEKAIGEFVGRYNREWMLERLGYLSPIEALNAFYTVKQKSA
jgi:transposase InsO family protein